MSFDTYQHIYIPAKEKISATILLLHGMGGDESSLLKIAKAIAPTMSILSLRGNVIENRQTRFYKSGFLLDDIKEQSTAMQSFCEEAARTYGFDSQKMVACGWSNGANMVSLLLLYAPGFLKGAMLFRPMLPPAPSPLPSLCKTPVFISGGRCDEVDPPEESEQLAETLRKAGATVAFRWHEGGHAIAQDDIETAASWVQTSFSPT